MNINLRLATIKDVPALGELISRSVTVLSEKYYTSTQVKSALSHVFGVDTQLILDGTYFIAEVEKLIVGSGGWSKRKTLFGGDQAKANEPDRLLNPESESARIRAFYVHPEWSRKGIATLILNACEAAARDSGFRSIELVATLPGVPFYSARGYQAGEDIPIETPDLESLPALRMTKQLGKKVET